MDSEVTLQTLDGVRRGQEGPVRAKPPV